MPLGGLLTAGVASLGTSILGSALGSGDRQSAKDALAKAMSDLTDIGVPSVEAQEIILDKYKSAGLLTPEMEQAIRTPDSDLNKISTDPSLKQAQLDALNKLQSIGNSGGLQLSDQAALNQTFNDVDAQDKGRRDALMQQEQARGLGGSGFELAAGLANAQAASQNENQRGMDIAAGAQQRALDAIMQGGTLAGSIQSTQFNQQAQQAAAQDAINKFNTANSQAVVNANTTAANDANQYNLTNNQTISNANTDLANKQEQYNKQLAQQQYEDQLKKASQEANIASGQANNFNADASNTADIFGGIASGITKVGTAVSNKK